MRQPKPFFRTFDGWWYVQVNEGGKRKQIKLAKGRENEKLAWTRYHHIMSKPQTDRTPLAEDSVVGLLDLFFEEHVLTCADGTQDWYRNFLESFGRFAGRDLLLHELTPGIVTKWINSTTWSKTTKNGAVRAIRRAFRWLHEQGYISEFPLVGLKAPKRSRREVFVTQEHFDDLLAAVHDDRFADLLRFIYLTGCRPQEAWGIEGRHCQLPLSRIVFPPSESKGQEFPRVIYLSDEAKEIAQRLLEKHSHGHIFRNSRGKPWNRNSVRCRFRRIRDKVGQLCAYHLRHSWATRALQRLDPITVSVLMGHSDASTVARQYQHLAKQPEFLQDAVNKVKGEDA